MSNTEKPLDLPAIRARVKQREEYRDLCKTMSPSPAEQDVVALLAAIDRVAEIADMEPVPPPKASERQHAWATGFKVAMHNVRAAIVGGAK